MYLNDSRLRDLCDQGEILVVPPELAHLITTEPMDRFQPASVELHLHPLVRVQQKSGAFKDHDLTEGPLTLKQGDFLLASIIEECRLPNDHLARVEGKSSLARVGLVIHCTGGFIDPGFHGNITLEIAALGRAPVVISAGQKIAQLAVAECYPSRWPYGHEKRKSKYQNQVGATPAIEEV